MDGFLPSRTISLPSEQFASLAGSDPAASGGPQRLNKSASTSPVERYSSEGDTREIFLDLQGLSDSGTAEQSEGDVVGKDSKTVVVRKRSGPKSRSSVYKGVTQYKKTGRWEAHIWLPNPNGRGSQRHLGSYETAENAARAFDRATIHLRGRQEELNFPWSDYENDDFLREVKGADEMAFFQLIRERFALPSSAKRLRRKIAKLNEEAQIVTTPKPEKIKKSRNNDSRIKSCSMTSQNVISGVPLIETPLYHRPTAFSRMLASSPGDTHEPPMAQGRILPNPSRLIDHYPSLEQSLFDLDELDHKDMIPSPEELYHGTKWLLEELENQSRDSIPAGTQFNWPYLQE
eukprot:jgi/Picsp_1/3881/NSC_01393-R1_ap2 domain transcription factor